MPFHNAPHFKETAIYRLLTLLSFAELCPDEESELKYLVSTVIQDAAENGTHGAELAHLISLNATTVWSLQQLERFGLLKNLRDTAPHIWDPMADQSNRLRIRGQKRTQHLLRLLGLANQRNIKVVLLKGSMLGPEVYKQNSYKKMNDVDILIRPEDVERMQVLAQDLGFEPIGALFDEQENDLKNNHHLSPLVSSDLSFVLGVHWGLASPHAKWRPDLDKVWAAARELTIESASALRLAPEHNLAHLCMHLPFYKIGLRELSDIYNIIRHEAIDWQAFVRIAGEWRITGPCYRVLTLCHVIADVVPMDVLDTLKPQASGLHVTDTAQRVADSYRLFRSRSVQVGRIEKAFGFFRIAPGIVDRTRAIVYMWQQTLFPPLDESIVLLALNRTAAERAKRTPLRSLGLRIQAGKRIWLAMAVDYGQLALVYMTARNVVTWFKTALSYMIKPVIVKSDARLLDLQELLE